MDIEMEKSDNSSVIQYFEQQCVTKLAENDFRLNKDKTIDARDKNFRQCLQFANNKPYPTNKDGSPDMRCTTNPHILRFKLEKLMKK